MTNYINTIKTRLTEIARTVPNIKRADVEAPAALPLTDLPYVNNFVGPVTDFSKIGDELAVETRSYVLRLYVKPAQSGYDGEAEKAVEPFLISFRDVFLSHPSLGLGTDSSDIDFVEKMDWLGDGGVMVFPIGEKEKILGTEFRISVKTIVPITFANYE